MHARGAPWSLSKCRSKAIEQEKKEYKKWEHEAPLLRAGALLLLCIYVDTQIVACGHMGVCRHIVLWSNGEESCGVGRR
jgi:hypothetical protein